MILRAKIFSEKLNQLWLKVPSLDLKQVRWLKVSAESLYRILGRIHLALIIEAGFLIAGLGSIIFEPQLKAIKPVSLLFFVLYIICDLVRLNFLRGATISLGFPLVFLTLLADTPFAASLIAILGSLLSEVIRSTLITKQRLPAFFTLRRALLYAGHHAVASLGALAVYQFIFANYPSRLLPNFGHAEAILTYVIAYSLISMLLVRPHDLQIRLFLVPEEDPLVRIDFLTTLLLLPLPGAVFYLSNLSNLGRTEKLLVVLGILPVLFVLLFYLAHNYTKIEEERLRLSLRESVGERLGSPANLGELVERILMVMEQLVTYRWGAVYSFVDGEFELCGLKSARGTIIIRNPFQAKEEAELKREEEKVNWPLQIKLGEGTLGKFIQENLPPQFFDSTPSSPPSDLSLAQKTALIVFPITTIALGEESNNPSQLIGLVILARPKHMFNTWDREKGLALSSKSGSIFLSVQRLERTIRDLYQKVEDYATDREKVRSAMQELIRRKVDVSRILAVVAERSFHGSLRAVLEGVVEKQHGSEISLPLETLNEIYEQVRDETPGMPPLDETILRLLQTVTSSLSLAFSFRYQFPNVERGPAFKEFYEFLLRALDANTISKIAALDREIETTAEEVTKRERNSREAAKLPAEVLEEFLNLQRVTHPLIQYSNTNEAVAKKAILENTLEFLKSRERDVSEKLRDPERFVLLQILHGWRLTIITALENLAQGPAHLNISLRNRQALPLPEVAVGLVLHNEGPGVASSVVVQLQPSAGYEPLKNKADLGTLTAGKTLEPELSLRPLSQDSLRLQFQISYHDPERRGKVEQFADLLHLREAPSSFSEIPNPYTPGAALKPGTSTFFGRDDIFEYIRRQVPALAGKMILVLVGERRTGKTSILRQLSTRLQDPCTIPIFIDGQRLGIDEGLDNFFLSLSLIISEGLEEAGINVPPLRPKDLGRSPQYVFERSFLATVLDSIGERNLLLTLDEFEELGDRIKRNRLPREIFPYLRSLIQHQDKLAFIFAGTHKIEELNEPWPEFFNIAIYKRVSFLSQEEALCLITEPVQPYGMVYDDLAIEEILRLTACHPYFTQLLCSILVNRCNEIQHNYVTAQDVRAAVGELLETSFAHLSFLWQTASREDRLCLAALAELQDRMEQVTIAAITDRLRSYQVTLDSYQVMKTIDHLVNRELIRETPGDPAFYSFTAQLYAAWLRRHQSLSKVAVEEASRESLTK